MTKHIILLSDLNKLFDPFGLLVLVLMKKNIFTQKICHLKMDRAAFYQMCTSSQLDEIISILNLRTRVNLYPFNILELNRNTQVLRCLNIIYTFLLY